MGRYDGLDKFDRNVILVAENAVTMSFEKALDYSSITFEGKIHDALKPTNINSSLGELFNFEILLAQ